VERKSGLVVFFLAVVILWQGRGLSFGGLHAPGPGFFPTLIAAVLIILSLFLIIPGAKGLREGNPLSASSFIRMLIVFAALVGYFFFLEYLGFVIISFLLMAFLFLWVARQKWYFALSSAVICIGLAYLLFDVLLKSNLPSGVFGF
jgi:putative tricarboxylic transport membrane protein